MNTRIYNRVAFRSMKDAQRRAIFRRLSEEGKLAGKAHSSKMRFAYPRLIARDLINARFGPLGIRDEATSLFYKVQHKLHDLALDTSGAIIKKAEQAAVVKIYKAKDAIRRRYLMGTTDEAVKSFGRRIGNMIGVEFQGDTYFRGRPLPLISGKRFAHPLSETAQLVQASEARGNFLSAMPRRVSSQGTTVIRIPRLDTARYHRLRYSAMMDQKRFPYTTHSASDIEIPKKRIPSTFEKDVKKLAKEAAVLTERRAKNIVTAYPGPIKAPRTMKVGNLEIPTGQYDYFSGEVKLKKPRIKKQKIARTYVPSMHSTIAGSTSSRRGRAYFPAELSKQSASAKKFYDLYPEFTRSLT